MGSVVVVLCIFRNPCWWFAVNVGRINFSSNFASGESSEIGLHEDPSPGGLLRFSGRIMFPIFRQPGIFIDAMDRFINLVRYVTYLGPRCLIRMGDSSKSDEVQHNSIVYV